MRSPPPPRGGILSVCGTAGAAPLPVCQRRGSLRKQSGRMPSISTARAQNRAERAEHPGHKRPPDTQKPEYAKGAGGAPPHAGVAGRILRLQVEELLSGLLRRGLTSGRLLRGSRLCGRLLSSRLLSRSGLLRGGLTLDRALRALVSK